MEYHNYARQQHILRQNEMQMFQQLQDLHMNLSKTPLNERNPQLMSDYQQKIMHALMMSLEEVTNIDMQLKLRQPIHTTPTSTISNTNNNTNNNTNTNNTHNTNNSSIVSYPPTSMLPLKQHNQYILGYMDTTGHLTHTEAHQPLIAVHLPNAHKGDIWSLSSHKPLPLGLQVSFWCAYTDIHNNNITSGSWILGKIIQIDANGNYIVQDEDLTHPNHPSVELYQKMIHMKPVHNTNVPPLKTYTVGIDKITPLPSYMEFPYDKRAIFPPNTFVHALYPVDECSTFYQARVVKTPMQLKKPIYLVRFDEEDEDRYVHTKFIFPMKTK